VTQSTLWPANLRRVDADECTKFGTAIQERRYISASNGHTDARFSIFLFPWYIWSLLALGLVSAGYREWARLRREERSINEKLRQIQLDRLSEVTLICTDALGAPEGWLVAKFRDGTEATFASTKEKEAFVGLLAQRFAELAGDIAHTMSAKDQPANFERLWTVNENL
jgi:hypothetical protein